MTRSPLAEPALIVATAEHVHCAVGDEAVVLHVGRGTYYGLNAVGARIWALVQAPRTVGEILDRLTDEFEVDRDTCARDLAQWLEVLEGYGLVEVRGA